MKVITIFSTASAVLLSACASATPPSITADQVTAIGTKYERLSALPDTAIADLPPGAAQFDGHLGGEISGDADGSVLGDMTMNVNFAGNTITGTVDNLNLISDDGIPERLLGGSLSIAGSEADGILTATATGTLDAVGEESVRGSSDVTLSMNGNVLTDVTAGDTVEGSLSGSGSGDFDINIYNGGFFGQ